MDDKGYAVPSLTKIVSGKDAQSQRGIAHQDAVTDNALDHDEMLVAADLYQGDRRGPDLGQLVQSQAVSISLVAEGRQVLFHVQQGKTQLFDIGLVSDVEHGPENGRLIDGQPVVVAQQG